MANRLTMQTLMAMLVLGLTTGASAEGEVVTPVQQDKVDMGTAIALDQAAAAQAGIQAALGGMQAVASAMVAPPLRRPTPRFDFDGSPPTRTEQNWDWDLDLDTYDRWKDPRNWPYIV